MRASRLITFGITLLLTACVTTPKPVVDYDPGYDFSQVKSFSWYEKSGKVSGDNPLEMTDFQKERVNTALSRALQAKGLTYVEDPDAADVLLSWHVNINSKTDVRTYSTPNMNMGIAMGYGRYNRYAMYTCFTCARDTDVRVTEYNEGTFIVDLIDPKKQQSVWRSVTQSRVNEDNIRDQATLDDAATRILSVFPPSSGVR
ncbi:MAG: DUF4136 domain-containing protein [Halieaceae bacterium]|jgi:hypothetical protein|nr:DUF4136 domain-containing protein [Halieaceae bacterium]